MSFTTIDCPWCWERFELAIDEGNGETELVEDCQVCCQPILLQIRYSADSAEPEITAVRENG